MRVFILLATLIFANLAHSSLIIQSYEKPASDVNFGGIGISDNYWAFQNFEVTSTFSLSSIGGYFSNHNASTTIFGAVVRLDNLNDVPDSFDLDTPDVLGTTTFEIGTTYQQDFSGSLSLLLDPGYYAVGFGLGAFGADNADFFTSFVALQSVVPATSINTSIIGVLPYSMIRAGNPFGPERLVYQLASPRIFMQSSVAVPAPPTLGMLILFCGVLMLNRRTRSNA